MHRSFFDRKGAQFARRAEVGVFDWEISARPAGGVRQSMLRRVPHRAHGFKGRTPSQGSSSAARDCSTTAPIQPAAPMLHRDGFFLVEAGIVLLKPACCEMHTWTFWSRLEPPGRGVLRTLRRRFSEKSLKNCVSALESVDGGPKFSLTLL